MLRSLSESRAGQRCSWSGLFPSQCQPPQTAGHGIRLHRDHVAPFRLPRDDGLVGDSFVGVARDGRVYNMGVTCDIHPHPAVVNFSFDLEFQTKVSVVNVAPWAFALGVGVSHAS